MINNKTQPVNSNSDLLEWQTNCDMHKSSLDGRRQKFWCWH